jgi:hypothetical protein
MSYKPSTSARECVFCGNAIEDGESLACVGCYDRLNVSYAKSRIKALRDEINGLERELEGLPNEA